MDGAIWVESEEGAGSRFHFTIAAALAPGQSGHQEPVSLAGCRVLLADDVAATRKALASAMERRGALVTTVASGRQAIAALREAGERGEPYRLLLLDSVMPEVSGFEVAEALHRGEVPAVGTVMMISAAGLRGDAQRCQNSVLAPT